MDHQSVFCDDPLATKKYEDICKVYGDYHKDVKDDGKDKNEKWDGNRCEFDHNIMIEKQFELELCDELG
jgi:hypothetical protein